MKRFKVPGLVLGVFRGFWSGCRVEVSRFLGSGYRGWGV